MRRSARAAVFLFLFVLAGCSWNRRDYDKPNVVILMTDDQGFGDVGAHGNPHLKTPHLDRLFETSVRFTNFHVSPTCAPTRAALMTGRYANRTGVWHTVMGRSLLGREETTMAEIFSANGYRTGIFGKWHLGDNYPYRPQDRGFEESFVHGGGGVGQIPDFWGNDYFDDTYLYQGQPKRVEGYCTDVWFNEAIDFIERHRQVPFLCYLAPNAPHSPYRVDDRYSLPFRRAGLAPDRASFYGMITNIDENLGRLLDRLDRLDLSRKTIFIFLTDNGTAEGVSLDGDGFVIDGFNSGMRGKKGSPYEGGHRVPLFLKWPEGGFEGGREVSDLTAHIDLLPTLLELCGLPRPEGVQFDGISLKNMLMGTVGPIRERILVVDSQRLESPVKWRQSAVMSRRWRLIDGRQLFQILSDPGQKNDVAADHPDEVDRLRRTYEEWWDDLGPALSSVERIVVGRETGETVRLTCHDWHYVELSDGIQVGGEKNPPWNQTQVSSGQRTNGTWTLEVVRPGRYEIVLRRWPAELDRSINDTDPSADSNRASTSPARIVRARIDAGEQVMECPVDSAQSTVVFNLNLNQGELDLRATFFFDDGDSSGAYYAYLKSEE